MNRSVSQCHRSDTHGRSNSLVSSLIFPTNLTSRSTSDHTSLPCTNFKPKVPFAINKSMSVLMPSFKFPEIVVIRTRPHKGTLTYKSASKSSVAGSIVPSTCPWISRLSLRWETAVPQRCQERQRREGILWSYLTRLWRISRLIDQCRQH